MCDRRKVEIIGVTHFFGHPHSLREIVQEIYELDGFDDWELICSLADYYYSESKVLK